MGTFRNMDLKKLAKPTNKLWHFTTDEFFEKVHNSREDITNYMKRKNIVFRHNMVKDNNMYVQSFSTSLSTNESSSV